MAGYWIYPPKELAPSTLLNPQGPKAVAALQLPGAVLPQFLYRELCREALGPIFADHRFLENLLRKLGPKIFGSLVALHYCKLVQASSFGCHRAFWSEQPAFYGVVETQFIQSVPVADQGGLFPEAYRATKACGRSLVVSVRFVLEFLFHFLWLLYWLWAWHSTPRSEDYCMVCCRPPNVLKIPLCGVDFAKVLLHSVSMARSS